MAIPVVLDTDVGSDMDDSWALAMLLGCPELDLRLVVTATADTTYRAPESLPASSSLVDATMSP